MKKQKWFEWVRIVWAIAWKDIVDALKNKTTLSTLITLLFVLVAYRYMPNFTNTDILPRMVILDHGQSGIVELLETSEDFDLFIASSMEELEIYLGRFDFVILGVELPPEFDAYLQSGMPLELTGYTIHWATNKQVNDVVAFFEDQLHDYTSADVRIQTQDNTVYTRPDSRGFAFLQSILLIIILTISGVSLTPALLLEEKIARTIDALMISPANTTQLVLGKAISGLFYCGSIMGIAFAFNTRLITQWGLLILASTCGAIFFISIGIFLGSVIEHRQQIILWAWVCLLILLVPVFLSILTDILPEAAINIIKWIPSVTLVNSFRASFSNQAVVMDWLPGLWTNLLGAFVMIGLVTWVIKRYDR